MDEVTGLNLVSWMDIMIVRKTVKINCVKVANSLSRYYTILSWGYLWL